MNVVLKNVMLMEKEVRYDKDKNMILCFNLYQKGCKNIIIVKDVPEGVYSSTKEGVYMDIPCKLTHWVQGSSSGISLKWSDLVEGTNKQ